MTDKRRPGRLIEVVYQEGVGTRPPKTRKILTLTPRRERPSRPQNRGSRT